MVASRMRYRVRLICNGAPASAAPEAAKDITQEFAEHRTWHQNVSCSWDGTQLVLVAENDYDDNGLALLDEFSDCIAAYISGGFEGSIDVQSVEVFNE